MKTARPKTNRIALCGMVACGLFAGAQASHAIDAIDHFDYADGALAGQNGGSGWNGAWYHDTSYNATINVAGGKLDFVSAGTEAKTSDIFRDLAEPISNKVAYVSVRMKNQNGGLRYFGIKPFTTSMLIGSGSTQTNWTIDNVVNGTNTILISSVPNSSESLLVLKVEFDAAPGGVNEMVTFWVNPDESVPVWQLDVADAVGGQSYETSKDYGSISRLRVVSGGYSTHYTPGYTDFTADDIQIVREPLFVGDVAISPLPNTNAVALSWATGSSDISYSVEKKTDLTDTTWDPSITGIPGNGGDVTVTTAVEQAESFFRVTGE